MRRAWLGLGAGVLTIAAGAAAALHNCGTLAGVAPTPPPTEESLARIELPAGFSIAFYAQGVDGARSLAAGPPGVVFVGSRGPGKVHALVDRDGDHRADEVLVVAEGLNSPNGVAYHEGSLYVAEISRILVFRNLADRLSRPPQPEVLVDDLPREEHPGWKFIAIGPDGWLYVPVGAPCNVCQSDDRRFASILRLRPDGTGLTVFAEGVRNTVGFAFHPETEQLWFTDNGRDWLGDDSPPDELNHAPTAGLHFGFPFCHAGDTPDPDFGAQRSCAELRPPAAKLGAHVAALGMRFYTGTSFPATYRGGIFIAEHGSWNRSSPVGYRVSHVKLDGDRVVGYEPFATGWLDGNEAWGRPVDVLMRDDGSLLVSDDKADAVYRITYAG